jgi:hypothetical protein
MTLQNMCGSGTTPRFLIVPFKIGKLNSGRERRLRGVLRATNLPAIKFIILIEGIVTRVFQQTSRRRIFPEKVLVSQ